MDLHSHRLSNDCVQVWEGRKLIVIKITSRSRLPNFVTDSVLNVWMLRQQMEDSSRRCRSRVSRRKYERAGVGCEH